jgi:hypothetical protein
MSNNEFEKKKSIFNKGPLKKAELKLSPVMRPRFPCWKAITKKQQSKNIKL